MVLVSATEASRGLGVTRCCVLAVDRLSTILIDCGKSFYEAAIAVFPECKIRSIEGIILTRKDNCHNIH